MSPERRFIAAVIGSAHATAEEERVAGALGAAVIAGGFRLVTGGLDGVMLAASRGAREAAGYQSGDVIGVLPSYEAASANPYVDIPICTGLNHARNLIVVATADVVLVVGGWSGTLSEMALAWQIGRPVIAVQTTTGWGGRLAGAPLDERRQDVVHGPLPPEGAVALARELVRAPRVPLTGFG